MWSGKFPYIFLIILFSQNVFEKWCNSHEIWNTFLEETEKQDDDNDSNDDQKNDNDDNNDDGNYHSSKGFAQMVRE